MIYSWVQTAAPAALNPIVEPPCKKRKRTPSPPPPPPSFLSLPEDLILSCLARVPKSYYPKLSLVCKTFRSLILSIGLSQARFNHKTQESFLHVCLLFPDRPNPSWFTLWINPDLINKAEKKKKSTLVQVPSYYYSRAPLLCVTVGSDIYALRQCYPPSRHVLVRDKERCIWREAPDMTVARENPAACVLDGKIYVMGGCAANESVNCWGEVFDPNTKTWEPLPDPGAELRFSLAIRKLEIIQGRIYVRSHGNKDSVYDPREGKWNVAAKARVGQSSCMVGNRYYACREKCCLWYDVERKEWIPVKGLSSLYKGGPLCLIDTVSYGGKLLILWDKLAKSRGYDQEKSICCALVALERRKSGQVWGKVEWSNVVLTVPDSYAYLRSSVIHV